MYTGTIRMTLIITLIVFSIGFFNFYWSKECWAQNLKPDSIETTDDVLTPERKALLEADLAEAQKLLYIQSAPQFPGSSALNVNITSVDLSEFPKIKAYVAVTTQDRRPVLGLDDTNFKVYENNRRESPISVSHLEKQLTGLSIALVMDVSGSMTGAIAEAQKAAISFVNQISPEDKAMLIKFNHEVELVQGLTNDKGKLNTAINNLSTGGYTALYDAIHEAISRIASATGIRSVVVLTDGIENRSSHSSSDIITYAQAEKVPVYTIGLGNQVYEDILLLIAKGTGGQFYKAPTPNQLRQLYDSIASTLQNLYEVTYMTHDKEFNGTTRSLTIRINANGIEGQDTTRYNVPFHVDKFYNSIEGRVLDDNKQPIPYARIIVERKLSSDGGGGGGGGYVFHTSTIADGNGMYHIELSPNFIYRFTASALGYHPSKISKDKETITLNPITKSEYGEATQDIINKLATFSLNFSNTNVYKATQENAQELLKAPLEQEAVRRLYMVEYVTYEAYLDAELLAHIGTEAFAMYVDMVISTIVSCEKIIKSLKENSKKNPGLEPLIPLFEENRNLMTQRITYLQQDIPQDIPIVQIMKLVAEHFDAVEENYYKIFNLCEYGLFLSVYERRSTDIVEQGIKRIGKPEPKFGRDTSYEDIIKRLEGMNSYVSNNVTFASIVETAGDVAEGIQLLSNLVGITTAFIAGAEAAAIPASGGTTAVPATLTGTLAVYLEVQALIAVHAAILLNFNSFMVVCINIVLQLPQYLDSCVAAALRFRDYQKMVSSAAPALEASPFPSFQAPASYNFFSYQQSENEFNSRLSQISEYIRNNQPENVKKMVGTLISEGKLLTGEINVKTAPIWAATQQVATQQKWIKTDYGTIYGDFVSELANFDFERANLYASLGAYLVGAQDASIQDLMIMQMDKTIDANAELDAAIERTKRAIINARIPIPDLVIVKNVSPPKEVITQTPFAVGAIIKNIGKRTATNIQVHLKVQPTSGFRMLNSETQVIDSLASGEEQEISWNVLFQGRSGSKAVGGGSFGTIVVSPRTSGSDFATLPPTYIFITTPFTPNAGPPIDNKKVYAYPNPFNPAVRQVNIRYSPREDSNVTIQIFDVSGELVATLIKKQPRIKALQYSEPWNGRNERGDIVANGVYFYLITTTAGEKAAGKIAVLR